MEPRPVPAHARPKNVADADAELVTLSRSTVKHAFTTLRRILDVAVVDGAIAANPCAAVPRTRTTDPDAEPFTARPLTAAEIAAVAEHIGRVQGHPIYGLVVLFAAFTRLRAGELAGHAQVGEVAPRGADRWLAGRRSARYLANDHPHGNLVSADFDPTAPLFAGR
jgi:integrase